MKKLLVCLLFSLLVLSLVACGDDAPADTAPQESAPEVAEPVDEPAPEPTEAPEPTAVPTAEPDPTAVPTAEPEPVEEPASAASGEGWGESNTTAQSACDHPYFPLRTGTTWTMTGSEGSEIVWEVLEVDGDLDEAQAEMQMTSGELELTYTWECTGEDGLSSFEFANLGMAAFGEGLEMEITRGEGQFLPAADDLQTDFEWDTVYESTFSMTQSDGDLDLTVEGDTTTEQTTRVVNTDPVTFEGATVDGVLLEQESLMTMVMSLNDNEVSNQINLGGELQLGRGIGMISQTTQTDFGDVTMELTDYYVP